MSKKKKCHTSLSHCLFCSYRKDICRRKKTVKSMNCMTIWSSFVRRSLRHRRHLNYLHHRWIWRHSLHSYWNVPQKLQKANSSNKNNPRNLHSHPLRMPTLLHHHHRKRSICLSLFHPNLQRLQWVIPFKKPINTTH